MEPFKCQNNKKALQLACKQVRYGFTKNSPHFIYRAQNLYRQIACSCYCTLMSYEQSDLYMLVTTRLFLLQLQLSAQLNVRT